MKVKDLMNQIEHIDREIENMQRLQQLDENLIYEIEKKAGIDGNIDIMVDVCTDAMLAYKDVLQSIIENAEVKG